MSEFETEQRSVTFCRQSVPSPQPCAPFIIPAVPGRDRVPIEKTLASRLKALDADLGDRGQLPRECAVDSPGYSFGSASRTPMRCCGRSAIRSRFPPPVLYDPLRSPLFRCTNDKPREPSCRRVSSIERVLTVVQDRAIPIGF
jgi:hypothetical protein